MVTAADLVRAASILGVTLHADGPRLVARGATHLLSPELRAAISAAKPALIAFLARPRCALCLEALSPRDGERCRWCAAIAGRWVEYAPGSRAEQHFLTARAAQIAVQPHACPSCPSTSS